MPRLLTFIFQDRNETANIEKFDRKRLYGWSENRVYAQNNQECESGYLLEDENMVLPKNATANILLSNDGTWIDKSQLGGFSEDGEELELIDSSFNDAIELNTKVGAQFLLEHAITNIYLLKLEERLKRRLLDELKRSDEVFYFYFSYTKRYAQESAFLVSNGEELFILSGKRLTFEYVGTEDLNFETLYEESLEIDAVDFAMM